MEEVSNINHYPKAVGEGWSCTDPHLCFKDGRLYIFEYQLNGPATPIDVTEQVAKAIAQYIDPKPAPISDKEANELAERFNIENALLFYKGNRKLAAQHLGISDRTLYRKIKQYEIDIKED